MNLLQSDINTLSAYQDRLFHISAQHSPLKNKAAQIVEEDIRNYIEQLRLHSLLTELGIEIHDTRQYPIDELYTYLTKVKSLYLEKLSAQKRVYKYFKLFFSVFFALNLALFIFLFYTRMFQKKNRQYKTDVNDKVLEILEKDRALISYELHDDLAQKLAQINQFFNNPSFEDESFELLKQYTQESIQQIRLVSNRLKTPVINGMNLRESYEQLFSDYKILTGMNLNYKIIGLNGISIPESKIIHIFRIIQELLNNANKHSKAEQVDISIIYSHPDMIIKYKDNGVGYDYKESQNTGLGLSSIQFRITMLGARVTHMDTQSNGVSIIFKVPVQDEENTIN